MASGMVKAARANAINGSAAIVRLDIEVYSTREATVAERCVMRESGKHNAVKTLYELYNECKAHASPFAHNS